MASNYTMTMTFKLEGDDKGFKNLSRSADGLKKAMAGALEQGKKFNAHAINFAAVATGIDQARQSVGQLMDTLGGLAQVYSDAEVAQKQLQTVMKQRMNANQQDVEAINQVVAAQRNLGVIGGTVQVSGAQQVATFLKQKSSLETLIPAMNNMIAHQAGLNATSSDAVSVGNLMGKAMMGQTTALRRAGITFTDAENRVMKYGNETERASMLSQVIKENFGNINAELAKTDSGKVKQLQNRIAGVKKELGGIAQGAMPFLNLAMGILVPMSSIITLTAGFKGLTETQLLFQTRLKATHLALLLFSAKGKSLSVIMGVMSRAFQGGIYSAVALKIAIRGLMITSVVGAAIAGLTYIIEKLTSSEEYATQQSQDLKDANQEYVSASADAKVAMDGEINKLGSLIRAKQDTSAEVEHLNSTYGDSFGTFDTASKWYDVLIQHSKDYVMQIGYEAQAKILATKIAEKQIQLDQNNEKRANLWKSGKAKTQGLVATGGGVYTNSGEQVDSKAYRKLKETGRGLVGEINSLQGAFNNATTRMNQSASRMRSSVGSVVKPMKTVENNVQSINERIKENNAVVKKSTDPVIVERLKAQNAELEKRKKSLSNTGAKTKSSSTKSKDDILTLPKELKSVSDYEQAISYWQNKQQKAGKEQYATIQKTIDALKEQENAFTGVVELEKKDEQYIPRGIEKCNTIKELNDELSYYQDLEESQSSDEITHTEHIIQALKRKQEALMRGTEIEAIKSQSEELGTPTGENLKLKIQAIGLDEIESRIKAIKDLLNDQENPLTAGQRKDLTQVVGLYEDWGKEAKKTNKVVNDAEGVQQVAGSVSNLAQSMGQLAGQSKGMAAAVSVVSLAASLSELVAGMVKKANESTLTIWDWIAGVAAGTATIMTTAAQFKSLAFANGGIVSGPTNALIGEYAGAKNNPEVVAPLDKLRTLIQPTGGIGGEVEFKIKGRRLVGILNREQSRINRS